MGSALAFLTILPARPHPRDRALAWFPAVGMLLGLVLGAVWWLADNLFPVAVAAAIVLVADLALTGMLHFDGLVDSGDGLLPHMERERRFEVMRQPDIGAFGLGAGIAVVLLRWSALASVRPSVLLLGGLLCLSRSSMALVITVREHARKDGGLAAGFTGEPEWAGVGLAASVLVLVIAAGVDGIVIAAMAGAGFYAAIELGRRRLGGYTGDVLGAAGIVGETVALIAASGLLTR